jgi:hypothetical protein
MYKRNYKKCFGNLLTAVAVVALAWFTLSYFEIIAKNTAPGPEYSNINLFIIFMEVFTK